MSPGAVSITALTPGLGTGRLVVSTLMPLRVVTTGTVVGAPGAAATTGSIGSVAAACATATTPSEPPSPRRVPTHVERRPLGPIWSSLCPVGAWKIESADSPVAPPHALSMATAIADRQTLTRKTLSCSKRITNRLLQSTGRRHDASHSALSGAGGGVSCYSRKTMRDLSMRTLLKSVLLKTTLYPAAKEVYRHTLNRDFLRSRKRLMDFYRGF